MLARMLRPLLLLFMEVLEEESPRVLAASLAFGMLLGFVPKDNLIMALLGVLLLGLRFNLTLATASAALFSGIAAMFDPIADALGRSVLTHPLFAEFWARLYQVPLMPWTRFNNTVVMGSLLLALGLMTPAYLLAALLVERYRPAVIAWVKQLKLDQFLGVANRVGVGEHG